ncbi:MAG: COX15/CtaA family protein [Phycisphaerae bacterium]|nr:COX15/CtaA family protein [Phycisphaerae bacterium]MCZ2401395.1 COX15/CtaA family protein [Phycisphaerae bacterium]
MTASDHAPGRDVGDMLALGFGTTVAMWFVGYLTHLPSAAAPGWVVFPALMLCLLAGGAACAVFTSRGLPAAFYVGCLTGVLNLLVLGSLLVRPDDGGVMASAVWWLPASVLLCGVVTACGAWLGRGLPWRVTGVNWPAAFALVAGGATLLLLSVGGVVTGYQAGLAVPDWPNSYGYNMYLYPLSRMTGGIYYEHAHRLFGSLVGLTTLVLAVYLQFREPRWWVRMAAIVALAAVVLQGVMGGLRVTGRLTLSAAPDDLAPSLTLAIAHGVFGQVFLALLAGLSVVLSRAWQAERPHVLTPTAATSRNLAALALAVLLLQLVLGALHRHTGTNWSLLAHIMVALGVVAVVGLLAIRLWALQAAGPRANALGFALLIALGVQFALGFAALIVTSIEKPGEPAAIHVIVTTLHQTTGALLLGGCAAAATWCVPAPARGPEPRGFPVHRAG